MKCPVCRSYNNVELDLHFEQFSEDIVECSICGSVWSVSHGAAEIVKDAQEFSFLEATAECVEGYDYSWAGA